ncbi:hypothetical protein GCM10010466_39220 [Planomonospora alba]|uniref:Uncharacterized protein n=1 Tax=Planomonospora alba TaxID=161354 RepID=A0ABP6NEY2_9ACTN
MTIPDPTSAAATDDDSKLCVVILPQNKVQTLLQGLHAACDEYRDHDECAACDAEKEHTGNPDATCEDLDHEQENVGRWQGIAAEITAHTGVTYP